MILLRLLGYAWSLPNTLLGLALCILYRAHSWRWSDGAIECIAGTVDGHTRIIGRPWAQTHGCIIVYDTLEHRENAGLRVHERVHVTQGMIGGVLFMVAYVLCFLALWAWRRNGWRDAYRANPFEVQAYRAGDRAAG